MLSARDLPRCELSDHLERRLERLLQVRAACVLRCPMCEPQGMFRTVKFIQVEPSLCSVHTKLFVVQRKRAHIAVA